MNHVLKQLSMLAFALVFTAGAAFAQQVETTTQQGDFNSSTVSQSGGFNTATVEQNSSATSAADGNTANITQTYSGGSNLENVATIQQGELGGPGTAKDVEAEISQDGENNQAQIVMVSNKTGGGGTQIENKKSEIDQDGADNQAYSFMRSSQGQFAETFIEQMGSDNYAYQDKDDEREGSLTIIQQSAFTNSDGVFAKDASTTGVGGSGNFAKQLAGKDQAEDLRIEQYGDGNFAVQDIFKDTDATTKQYGMDNYATIKTEGKGGLFMTINQGMAGADVSDNRATIHALGEDNQATINQWTNSNEAYLVQDLAGNNVATITQEGGDANYVNLMQSDGADATINQGGIGGNIVRGVNGAMQGLSLNGSTLTVDQFGGGSNVLELSQTNGGTSTVSQNGTSNKAEVVQN